jgi:hypothetical protein
MKNKTIQKFRAHWFAFKTNKFNMAGIRTGAKNGVVSAVIFLLGLNPLVWIFFGHLNSPDDQTISVGFVILSTTFVFAAIMLPLFMLLGTVFGFVIAKSLEKHLADWSRAKFTLRTLFVSLLIAIFFSLIGFFFIFDRTTPASLFQFILVWAVPLLTLVGFASFTSSILYQRALNGDL